MNEMGCDTSKSAFSTTKCLAGKLRLKIPRRASSTEQRGEEEDTFIFQLLPTFSYPETNLASICLFSMTGNMADLKMPKCNHIDIEETSIADLQAHLTAGRFTAVDLTECYLKRIESVNPYTR